MHLQSLNLLQHCVRDLLGEAPLRALEAVVLGLRRALPRLLEEALTSMGQAITGGRLHCSAATKTVAAALAASRQHFQHPPCSCRPSSVNVQRGAVILAIHSPHLMHSCPLPAALQAPELQSRDPWARRCTTSCCA